MFIAVEGPSAAGKTTWCSAHGSDGVVAETGWIEQPTELSDDGLARFWNDLNPGNPVTPTDYAGSRERDPHPEPTASLEHTAGKPARPDPPGANRRAPARLARHWQQHPNISARNPSNPTPSAALTVCDSSGRLLLHAEPVTPR